jgi:hypothetical protein
LPTDPEDWQDVGKALVDMSNRVAADGSFGGKIDQLLVPSFTRSSDSVGNLQAHDRLLIAALAILQERTRTGSLPAHLPLGLGKNGVDPFDGAALRYKKKGSGFIVYSIGRDRVDDGGKPRDPSSMDHEDYDEVLEFK